jgi:Zn finger protein HypA/HybF involved in hydrogenase expression
MCSGGGPFSVDLLNVEEKEYRCSDCGKEFKGLSVRPLCPMCKSDNVKRL